MNYHFSFIESCFILPTFIWVESAKIDQNGHPFQIVFLPNLKEGIKYIMFGAFSELVHKQESYYQKIKTKTQPSFLYP